MQNTGNTTNGNAQESSPSLSTLAERLKAKTEQDRQEIETLTRQQFGALQQSLSESSKNALSTTESTIQNALSTLEQSISSRCHTLSWVFGKRCLQAALLTCSIILAAALTGWGLMALAQNKATSLQHEIAALNTYKAELEKTAAQLEAKTWGLTLVDGPEGRFIILPVKSTLKPGWTIGKNPAWKLE